MNIKDGDSIVFKKENNVVYCDDFKVGNGIPLGIVFNCTVRMSDTIVLTAPNYGGDPYGNGSLRVLYRDLHGHEIVETSYVEKVVTNCGDCYFLHGECCNLGAGNVFEHWRNETIPDNCPLLTKPILVRVVREKLCAN